jgi:hypothetical protein
MTDQDPIILVKKLLLVLTKDEIHKVFWLLVDHIITNYCTEVQRRSIAQTKADSESVSIPLDSV